MKQKSTAMMGNKNAAKAVYQIDKVTGEIIKKWNYILEAANALHIHYQNIYACCRGRIKTAYGFIWRYVDVH